MSGKKTSFVLYNDYKDSVDKLDNEQAGKLFKMILDYVNGQDVEPENLLLELVFLPIKKSLTRDLQKYENKIQERSNAGILGNLKKHYPELYDEYKAGKIDVDEALKLAKVRKSRKSENTLANVADSVNGNGNGNGNASEIENKTDGVDDEKKITIAACEDLFLKNTEVYNAIGKEHKMSSQEVMKNWMNKFRNKLIKDEVKVKTPKDYHSHLDRWIAYQIKKKQNDSNNHNGPPPDSYESGKLDRL